MLRAGTDEDLLLKRYGCWPPLWWVPMDSDSSRGVTLPPNEWPDSGLAGADYRGECTGTAVTPGRRPVAVLIDSIRFSEELLSIATMQGDSRGAA
jgi:hypothetical protein